MLIPLTRGFVAVIDDGDAPLIARRKWQAMVHGVRVYAVRTERKRCIYMHRVILGISDRHIDVDHRDGDGLNNRRSNLRATTRTINSRNRGKYPRGTSRFVGVYWSKQRELWIAQIRHNGKMLSLGGFETETQANRARLKAERELWGIEPRREADHQCAS